MLGEGFPARVRSLVQGFAEYFPYFTHYAVRSGEPVLLTKEMAHGDGGFGDNLGVLPLLARQVHNILVFVNTSTQFFAGERRRQGVVLSGRAARRQR